MRIFGALINSENWHAAFAFVCMKMTLVQCWKDW